MGYPYAEATWDVAEGAMFMGGAAGSIAPLIYTLVAIAACIWALWSGNRKEHEKYGDYK